VPQHEFQKPAGQLEDVAGVAPAQHLDFGAGTNPEGLQAHPRAHAAQWHRLSGLMHAVVLISG
jgi:hypothetical protein